MVEVITPIHNDDPHLLERAIHSVKSQTTRCLHIIVDDFSNDLNSEQYEKICKKFNVTYLKTPENVGPGLARQYGLDHGYKNVDYVIFLDADDLLMPYAVKDLQSEIKKGNFDMVSGNILLEGATAGDGVIKFPQTNTWVHGKIYSIKFLTENNIRFSDKMFYNEDSYFNTVCIMASNNCGSVDKVMALWSKNPNSVTRKNDNNFEENENINYFKSNIYALDWLFNFDSTKNFGILIGQLYNSYEKECIYNHDLTLAHDLIKQFVTPKMDIILKHSEFMKQYIKRLEKAYNNHLFPHSGREFLYKILMGELL